MKNTQVTYEPLTLRATVLFSSMRKPDSKYPQQHTMTVGMLSDKAIKALVAAGVKLKDARTEDDDGNELENYGKLLRIGSKLDMVAEITYDESVPPELRGIELGRGTTVIIKGAVRKDPANSNTFKAKIVHVLEATKPFVEDTLDEDEAL